MQQGVTISVIIPAYNVELYIESCLKSVMEQQEASFEVVLINDGSTDCTGVICKSWAEKYSNIVYLEQKNKGQGTARNVAIDHASGEWLVFLDADDTMLPGALKYLEDSASENYDIFVYGCIFISENQESNWLQLPPSGNDKDVIMKEIMSVLWDKMFRTAFWKNNRIRLKNVYGEDVCPVYWLETQTNNICTLQIPLMCHYVRADNLSAKPEQIIQIVQTLTDTLGIFKEKGLLERYQTPLLFMILNHYKHYYRLWRLNNRKVERKIADDLKKLAEQHFSKEYQQLFDASDESLVIVGKISRPFPAEVEARDVYYYPRLEHYLSNEDKTEGLICHFIINVENEMQSVVNGTRSLNWALSYWKMQCVELLEIKRKKRIEGNIFLYSVKREKNELIENFEKIAKSLWDCIELKTLEDFWKYIDIRKYAISKKYDVAEDRISKTIAIKNFNFRGEYLRLDYNVNLIYVWLQMRQRGVKLETYFMEHKYKNIGIYGMGYLGKLLLGELEKSDVKISFLIDRNDIQESDYKVYAPESVLPSVDLIVVSVIHQYDEIKMRIKCVCHVVSLQEIVEWCEKRVYREKM